MAIFKPNIHHRRSIRLKGYDYAQAGLYFITICCQDRICRFGHIENGGMVLNAFGKIAYNEWIKLAERFPNSEFDVFQIMPNHMHGIIVLNTVGATLAVDQNDDAVAQNDDTIPPNDNCFWAGASPAPTDTDTIPPNDNCFWAGASPAPTDTDTIPPNDYFPNDNDTNVQLQQGQPQGIAPTIGYIIGAYKSLVANACLEIHKSKNEIMGKLWQRNYYEHIIRNEQSYQRISNYIINNPTKWANDTLNKK